MQGQEADGDNLGKSFPNNGMLSDPLELPR